MPAAGTARDRDGLGLLHRSDAGIGYIRLTQFNETTSAELREAVRRCTGGRDNLKGLILDLRYNPGGLLSEAVAVANFFIDSSGNVVTQEDGRGRVVERRLRAAGPNCPMFRWSYWSMAAPSASGDRSAHFRTTIAIVVGDRTFGKGRCRMYTLAWRRSVRLTTHFYKLPMVGLSTAAKTETARSGHSARCGRGDAPRSGRRIVASASGRRCHRTG